MKSKNKPKKEKLKSLRKINITKDCKDIKGWGISKGTILHVVNDSLPIHPVEGYRLLVVRVDNGTGMLELMPETVVRNIEVE